jgi:hypothetical protein
MAITKKSAAPAKKPAAKTTAAKKPMDALAKARAAKAKGGTAVKKKTTAKKFVYKAPADLKSCFVELGFRTAKDGFISPMGFTCEAIKGKWDNEKAPRYDLVSLDPATAAAVLSRVMLRSFATNPDKRLTPMKEFLLLIRVSVTGEGLIRARVAMGWFVNAKDKLQAYKDVKDPDYRKFRLPARFLGGAFTKMKSMVELKELAKAAESSDSSDEE